jgi:hypothetical protein
MKPLKTDKLKQKTSLMVLTTTATRRTRNLRFCSRRHKSCSLIGSTRLTAWLCSWKRTTSILRMMSSKLKKISRTHAQPSKERYQVWLYKACSRSGGMTRPGSPTTISKSTSASCGLRRRSLKSNFVSSKLPCKSSSSRKKQLL